MLQALIKMSKKKSPLQNRIVSAGLISLEYEIQIMIEKHNLEIKILENEIKYLKEVIEIHKRKGETS